MSDGSPRQTKTCHKLVSQEQKLMGIEIVQTFVDPAKDIIPFRF